MRFRSALAFATVALVAAAIGAFYYLSRSPAPQSAATHGPPFARAMTPKEIPALQFEDAAGHTRSLADFKGKLVLLNLWATWCAPCREEMPALDRLQAELGGPRFEVVALSIDQNGVDAVRKFYAEVGVRNLAIHLDPSGRSIRELSTVGVPTTLLLDREGRE